MTKTQSKWEKIVPKRLENVVDALTEHPWKGWNFGNVRAREEIPAEPGERCDE